MLTVPRYQFKTEDLLKSGRISKEKLDDLKQWASTSKDLPEMSEEQLAVFLLACLGVVENAKTAIKNYFKCRVNAPELFDNQDVDAEDSQKAYEMAKLTLIPRRTKDNYCIGIGTLKEISWYHFTIEPLIKNLFMKIQAMCYKDPPNGMIYIIDMKNVGLMHLTKIKFSTARKFFHYIQEGLPARLRKVHILNASYVFDKFMSMFKHFIKKELQDMIEIHTRSLDMEEFFEKYVEAECMPSDYGGLQPDFDTLSINMQAELRRLRPFFQECEDQVAAYKSINE